MKRTDKTDLQRYDRRLGRSEFRNKNVIVTGGGRGIGRAVVERFLSLGANVVVVEANALLAKELEEDKDTHSGRIDVVVGDASKEQTSQEAVKRTQDRFGLPDVLVNNVGRSFRGPIDRMRLKDWDEIVRVNLTSAFLFVKAVVPLFKEAKKGNIITISSISGLRGNAELAAYNATKFGLIGLTKGLAMELGPYHIRVNAICPGNVETEMLQSRIEWLASKENLSFDQMVEKMKAEIPLGRIASPWEIADIVLFLSSSASRYITGAAVPATGGKDGI